MVTSVKLMAVRVQVNNPESGEPTHQIAALESERPRIHLDGHGHEFPIKFEIRPDGRWFVMNDLYYRFYAHEVWKGNWCWDEIQMSVDDVADLVNQLLTAGWQVLSAATPIFTQMVRDKHIRAEDLAA